MSEHVGSALMWGAGSAALYAALFTQEKAIMVLTAQGRWTCLVPVAIAFAFSLVHGHFTGAFWEALGIRAKAPATTKTEDPLE